MASFNRVVLLGNLTRDPALKNLPSGSSVCEFGLAVNRKWRGQDGNNREETCFVDCTAWGKSGETINQYCVKGNPLLVEGRLKYDAWTGQDGQKRSKLSVVVEGFQFIGGGSRGGKHDSPNADASATQPAAASTPAPAADPVGAGADRPPTGDGIPF